MKRFTVNVVEDYKADPTARVYRNYGNSIEFDTLEEVLYFLKKNNDEIKKYGTILKRSNEKKGETIINKTLFKRPGRAARLLRTITVRESFKTIINDSLI